VKVQRQTKNHRGDNLTDDNSKDGHTRPSFDNLTKTALVISFALENASLFITSSFLLLGKCFCNPKRTVIMDFLVYHVPSALRTSPKVLYLFGAFGLHRLLTKTLKLANETVRRKMARFALLTDQDLDVIIDEDSKNTKSVIRVSEKILNDYLKDKDGKIKSIDEPNKYKTFIQSGRGTNNPRKRFTSLNSQTTGKGEK
jgi:hypothetical protein